MEKGAKSGSGFSISEKKSSSSDSDVSLMNFHTTEPFPSKIFTMGIHHQKTNLDRPFDGGGTAAGTGAEDGWLDPTGSNSGGANEVVGNIHREDVSSSDPLPFDTFAASCSSTPYKSPGMAQNMGFPFTSAQWKELERQAMIYKYMISSVPVPRDLLFPRNFDSAATSLYNSRYSKNGDPEPGRCKRTDGKKWRCSRDVAPHQKYCERHLHRGRPRSRKPVEVKNNGENHKKTRLEQSPLPNYAVSQANNQPLLLFNAKSDLSISTPPSYKESHRDLSLMIDGHLANMGFSNEGSSIYAYNALFHQDYMEQPPLNLLNYASTTGFIDAWSIDNLNSTNNNGDNSESSLSMNHGNLSPSLNLSIAMAAGDIIDEEMRKIQMGSGEEQITENLSPISWEPFARGGPLAEVLQPTNPASPISTPATTVSSPSGVLHRTLFSHSDSSVCNSPTFGAPPSEVAFHHRLN
ncbi:hypothetical protein CDL12_04360 [Handroanthus impetiginosus]|uniref:Growth-regulating factor n=1 Tax=Handroanthus impetiginosus TaxID=429701 RepID=A0A2G9HZL0_9LAMI|nr:hypothetical protein CDL12_04360 [Handroanthus impetiginosus]